MKTASALVEDSFLTFSNSLQGTCSNLQVFCYTTSIHERAYSLGPSKVTMTNFHQINCFKSIKLIQITRGMLVGSFISLSAIVFDEISGSQTRFKLIPHIVRLTNTTYKA